jgi:hypothetical protein
MSGKVGVRFHAESDANNSDICPVLKHGPRSLTCVRVCGLKIRARNESDRSECALAYMQLWPTLILGDRFEYEHTR